MFLIKILLFLVDIVLCIKYQEEEEHKTKQYLCENVAAHRISNGKEGRLRECFAHMLQQQLQVFCVRA